jgi:apolipoprotein N-acyltransferase
VAVWAGVGSGREFLLEDRPVVRARAVLVQPAVPLVEKRGPDAGQAALESLWTGLAEADGLLGEAGATMVVLPETHLPFSFEAGSQGLEPPGESTVAPPGPAEAGPARALAHPPWPQGLEDELAGWAAARGVALLVGSYRREAGGTRNALVHLERGGVVGAYDKSALVPGVERGPGGLVAGGRTLPLDVQGRPGPLICIESAWASVARRQALAGAGWLLNVSNDAWLGEGEGVGESPAFHQHPWHLILRSVETGRGALRVGNNGWTGSVDPFGRWRAALDPHRPGVAAATVTSLPFDPLFVRVGDTVGPLCLLLMLLGLTPRRSRSPR